MAVNSKQWDGGKLCGTCIEGFYLEGGYPVGNGPPYAPKPGFFSNLRATSCMVFCTKKYMFLCVFRLYCCAVLHQSHLNEICTMSMCNIDGGCSCRNNFKAIIDNLCPECEHGDLDFRQEFDGSGDGRWPLTWKTIPCPTFDGGLSVTRENGNRYYAKLKIEGGPSPVRSLNCGSIQGTKTEDAFFEFQDGSGTMCAGTECTVAFVNGPSERISVSRQQLGNQC